MRCANRAIAAGRSNTLVVIWTDGNGMYILPSSLVSAEQVSLLVLVILIHTYIHTPNHCLLFPPCLLTIILSSFQKTIPHGRRFRHWDRCHFHRRPHYPYPVARVLLAYHYHYHHHWGCRYLKLLSMSPPAAQVAGFW